MPWNLGLFSYNGCPNISELKKKYPDSSKDRIYSAVGDLYINRLSYGQGTSSSTVDPDVLRHRISSRAAFSAICLIDNLIVDGRFLIFICHDELNHSLCRLYHDWVRTFNRWRILRETIFKIFILYVLVQCVCIPCVCRYQFIYFDIPPSKDVLQLWRCP